MARVQLDASHVSKSVTARREKVTRYIRVLNELSEVRTFSLYSLRLRVVEQTVREDLHGSCSLHIWWYRHWLERWSAIGRGGAALFLCRFLRWISKRNGGSKRCARRSFDEAVSSVPVNRRDQISLGSDLPFYVFCLGHLPSIVIAFSSSNIVLIWIFIWSCKSCWKWTKNLCLKWRKWVWESDRWGQLIRKDSKGDYTRDYPKESLRTSVYGKKLAT